jgi:hypothetical protein
VTGNAAGDRLGPLAASDERAIVRQYALSRADLDLIAKKRTASNQLGFAVLMCGMRFPGRVLEVTETPPAAVQAFIADQVGAPPAQFATYRQRQFLRRLGIDAERQQAIPASAFDRIARGPEDIRPAFTCWSRLSSSANEPGEFPDLINHIRAHPRVIDIDAIP